MNKSSNNEIDNNKVIIFKNRPNFFFFLNKREISGQCALHFAISSRNSKQIHKSFSSTKNL